MGQLKVGDRVKSNWDVNRGAVGTIERPSYDTETWFVNWDNGLYCQNFSSLYLELISNESMKDLLTVFRNLNLKEPEKSFREAQITDSNGNLTSTGQQIFLSYLLQKYGEDFKKNVVDSILHEMKMGDCDKL